MTKTELLMVELDTWEGRKRHALQQAEFAQEQIDRIKSELGARVVKHLIVLDGGAE